MNPVNATAQYVSACRSVLQCDPQNPQSLAELFKILPFFRQSLCCLVCGNLLKDPVAPANSSCEHYVCKACKGKKMNMKPSCSWCKDYEQFQESKQLCILVECYKKLCEYIAESPLAHLVASSVGDCPEVLELMKEGLSLTECEPDEPHVSVSLSLSHSPTPSASETDCGAQPEASAELQGPLSEARVHPPSVNGLQHCNGLGVDELAASVPSPEDVSAPIVVCGVEPLPVCEAAAAGVLCADAIDMYGFAEDAKHGGPLLLSVEEVLRRLDPEPDAEPDPVSDGGLDALHPCTGSLQNPNSPFISSRQPSFAPDPRALAPCHPQPPSSCAAAVPKTAWLNRKRSRSESDSGKIQPLPIASIILGPRVVPAPVAAVTAVTAVTAQRVADVPAQPAATVTNGGAPKVSKLLLVSSSKGIKNNPELGAKKAYAKARQGVPKTKDKTKDRLSGNSLESGNPAKVVYKKPQEKKGCKCGRATQNPSVLTCRGQRCPCYSNRKACLDCICRGCQNSYMANGEKKLEAFAVPEKALEQTRLTLGINVTSIAVRNAGASASVLNAAAGSSVASFLTASSHEEAAFDETLDMRF